MKKTEIKFIIIFTFIIIGFVFAADFLQFRHSLHIEDETTCAECHESAPESTLSSDNNFPKKEVCENCHENDVLSRIKFLNAQPQYKLNFDHKAHLGRGAECKTCHKNLISEEYVGGSGFPSMETCFTCHDGTKAPKTCETCHLEPAKPKNHLLNWEKIHKIKASLDEKSCMGCHQDKSFCLNCHKGLEKPSKHHNPNYELTHKFDARVSSKNCSSCHKQNFCADCHKSSGVSSRSEIKIKTPHPAGWIDKTSPRFHANTARMRLNTCRACHDQSDCNFCHFTNQR